MQPIRVVSIMEADFVTGPAKNLIGFATRARAAGFQPRIELSIVTYERGSDPPPNAFVDAAREAGLTVDLVREKGRFDTAVMSQLREVLERRQPQIVQTHNVKSHFLFRLAGLDRKYHWLAFHHGYTTTDRKMLLYNQLDRWSLRAPRHLVTVCGAFQQQLRQIGIDASRITIRHNFIRPLPPVDAELRAGTRASIAAPDGTPILLCVGRLSREKGHLDLVEALARVTHLQWHLVVAGEGPERPKIEAALERHRLQDRVTLVGLQANIQRYYAIADLLVMPSHSEGSPNALLEAMIAGVPIVATAVGGIPEIVTDGQTARLVAARDAAGLAEQIAGLLKDPEARLRLAEAARAEAEGQYSPEAYCRCLAGIYGKLISAPVSGTFTP
jgi:glycosyltransferase involved in cell wall biosynthesis